MTLFGLPEEVKFCTKCVVSNQRPNSCVEYQHTSDSAKQAIHFDEEGVCDACRVADQKKTIDWDQRERELAQLCDSYRREDGHYDCLIPGSGGKDSVRQAWVLKNVYNMHPLTVTWAPHLYTETGRTNHSRWIDNVGIDNMLFTPNGKIHRLLTRLAFENLLHPFQPFVFGQKNIGPKIAQLYDIPLVFYGENEAEYGNPIADTQTSLRDGKYYITPEGNEIYLSGVAVSKLYTDYNVNPYELNAYMPVSAAYGLPEVHYLGYYLKWSPELSYHLAQEYSGFQPAPERTQGTYTDFNSIDDKTDPMHYYTTLIKFGIGRATHDACCDIRNGTMSRADGVNWVKLYDQEFPSRYYQEFLDYIGCRDWEFWTIVNRFRSPHLWENTGSEWHLRHTVWA